ncbi:MAG: Na(+)/H(+) antiporter subunit D, partial [Pseudomonadota bacterium]
SVNLDTDWTYRKFLPNVLTRVTAIMDGVWQFATYFTGRRVSNIISGLYRSHGPEGRMARVWPTGSMVLWIAILLVATLVANYV